MAEPTSPAPAPGGEDRPIPLEPTPEDVPTARLSAAKADEAARKARIDKPGLIADFPEDADFDKDPAVEFERKGAAAVARIRDEEDTDERPEFVRPFIEGLPLGEAKFWAIGACILLAGAAIAIAVTSPSARAAVLGILLTAYNALLNTGLGVVAIYIAAHLTERRVGRVELAAGRMFIAVSAFCLLINIPINIFGKPTWIVEELTIAALAYAGIVAGLFRVWGRSLIYIIAAHMALWLIVQVGMDLASWADAAAAAAAKAGAPS